MKAQQSFLKHLDFIVGDLLVVQLSFFLGNCIYLRGVPAFGPLYGRQALLLVLCVVASLLVGNPFGGILKRNKFQEVGASARHTVNLLVCYMFLLFCSHDGGFVSRLTVAYTWIVYFFLATFFRLWWKRVLRSLLDGRKRAGNALVLLTDSHAAEETVSELQAFVYAPYFITAIFLADYEEAGRPAAIAGIPVLGTLEDAVAYAPNHWVDEVMFGQGLDPRREASAERHFEKMGLTTHRVLLRLPEAWHAGTTDVQRYGNYLVSTHMLRYVPLWKWGVKRAFDIIGALIGLAVTGVVYLFVAPAIRHADKGPAIYTSIRIGKNGREFKFYKFRSMYADADKRKAELLGKNKMQGLMFKVDDDPRILPGIGTFIRKTSLDEFPQFWNVLKGDMSLVGTRPPTKDEWEHYGEEHRIRMTQRPGITGIWQVSGRSSVTDFNEIVKMDERYIETWTIGMDLTIILKTFAKVLKRDGAE